MRKILLSLVAVSLAVPAVPAAAERHHNYRHQQRDQRHYYRTGNGIQYWHGDDGRYYCRRSNGTTGLIVGAAAGALAGRAVDTRGDRAPGTIIGAVVGGLLGQQIERGQVRCR